MKTKRILSGLAALAVVSAVAPISAFAYTVVDDTSNPAPQSADLYVKYTYKTVAPTYTITIPAGVTLSDSDSVDATITAENVANMADNNLKIAVTLDAASNDADTDTTFHAKNGTSEATYTITAGTTAVKVGDKVAEFEDNTVGEQRSTLTFSKITLPQNPVSGDYTETLTFGISVENAAPANPYAANNIGDVITFGSYDWYIIGKSDDSVTLLMKNIKGTIAYDPLENNLTWENCLARSSLNDFYNSFSDEDKAKIALTHNSNPDNGNKSGGNDTDDYIYLLSIEEANALDSSIRNCGSSWWLRSPGLDSNCAAFVDKDGNINTRGLGVYYDVGVRPALTLKF